MQTLVKGVEEYVCQSLCKWRVDGSIRSTSFNHADWDQFAYPLEEKVIPIEVLFRNNTPFGNVVVEGLPSYATYSDNKIVVNAPVLSDKEQHEITVQVKYGDVTIAGIRFQLKVAGMTNIKTETLYVQNNTLVTGLPVGTDASRCIGSPSTNVVSTYRILDGVLYHGGTVVTDVPTGIGDAVMFVNGATDDDNRCSVLHSNGEIYRVSDNTYNTPSPGVGAPAGIKKITGHSDDVMFMTDTLIGRWNYIDNSYITYHGDLGGTPVDIGGSIGTQQDKAGFAAVGNRLMAFVFNSGEVQISGPEYTFDSPIVRLSERRLPGNWGETFILTENGKLYYAYISSDIFTVREVAGLAGTFTDVSGVPEDGSLMINDGRCYIILTNNVIKPIDDSLYPVTAIGGYVDDSPYRYGYLVAQGYLYVVSQKNSIVSCTPVTDAEGNHVYVGPAAKLYGTGSSWEGGTTMVVTEKGDLVRWSDDPNTVNVLSVNGAVPNDTGDVAIQAEVIFGDSNLNTQPNIQNDYRFYTKASQPQMVTLSFFTYGDGGTDESPTYGYIEAGGYLGGEAFIRRAYVPLSKAKYNVTTLTFMVAPGEYPAFRYEPGKTFPGMQVRATINNFSLKINPV